MNKAQKNLIIAFIIWLIFLNPIVWILVLIFNLWEFTRDDSYGLTMVFGGLSLCLVWWIVEKIRFKK